MRKLRQTLGVSQEINAETNTVIISTITKSANILDKRKIQK